MPPVLGSGIDAIFSPFLISAQVKFSHYRLFKDSVVRGFANVMIPLMRAYKFLNAHFGLKSLYERRLKISRLDELNDPFEFLPFDLSNRAQRWAVRETRKQLGEKQGILCFSAAWSDPVIWAHYSDKHKGLCLGFEIPENVGTRVTYV